MESFRLQERGVFVARMNYERARQSVDQHARLSERGGHGREVRQRVPALRRSNPEGRVHRQAQQEMGVLHMKCEQCGEPAFIEYDNGSVRCGRHAVPYALLEMFDPSKEDAP